MRFIPFVVIFLCPFFSHAETVSLEWEPSPLWIASGNDTSYMDLDFSDGDGILPRRIGVRFYNRGKRIAEVWDKPSDRSANISVELDGKQTMRLQGAATTYAGPWVHSTAYVLGDRISVGDYPSGNYWMEASRAGTSGATEPEWPNFHSFTLALEKIIAAGDAVDNGDDTITITLGTHLFRIGDLVTISGTVNYDGAYTLPDQTAAAYGDIIITAAYVAETFAGTETVMITGAQVTDNGDGTVSIPCAAHGYTGSVVVDVSGTTNYDGSYTLATQTDPDVLLVTATYVTEVLAGGRVIDPTIDDPDGAGVEWTFTLGDLPTGITERTGRIIGKLSNGEIEKSGVQYRLRSAP